ncbi:hypothetical protein D8674_030744 [Pyrus ussuriensis x Pyrus communis]|uniref:Uncharacterized protein n=1 Tax=Pyrus ussuriensis x Pyrus communis TaxID=2448454 RepID=A0A5N5F9Q4_9ROSA|nr:hypothetical protein D8674_030744 [Pyrus ussuriensis x Pyrus communis]
MLFFLTTKRLASFCTTVKPTLPEEPTIAQTKASQTWIENDFLAKNYILNGFRYLKYQMVDDKSVEAQSHELQKIAHEIISEGMVLNDQFQVAVIIDKLPPTWKNFKNSLRHKTKGFSLESLITRLRIEEEARKQEMKEEILVVSSNQKATNFNRNQTLAVLKPNGKNMKIQNKNHNKRLNNNTNKFECYNYHKLGHLARNCKNKKSPAP